MAFKFPFVTLKGPEDVLIVEDDDDVAEVLENYLELLGIFRNIIIASNGSSAVQKLVNQKFALILMDINIPLKSGLELIDNLKSSKQNLKRVIIVSGELNSQKLNKAITSGIKHFVVKPFTEEIFLRKVAKVLVD